MADRLADIRDKVYASQRLSFDDGVYLDRHADLHTLGELANVVRERKNGSFAYYNVNEHLNPTNVCVYRCTFCAFRADLKSPRGYVMSDEQIVERAAEADRKGATELHIVGGLHHQLPYAWYLNVIRVIHDAYPHLHLKAYTAVEWDWFQPFIPLAFHPDNTGLSHIQKPSGLTDLRVMAISRLMLDNFPHIKAYWVMLGIKTAQVALSYGADDIDGTVVHEKIYHDAGSDSPQELTVVELRRLIVEAGRVPVERDTLYHEVVREEGAWRAEKA